MSNKEKVEVNAPTPITQYEKEAVLDKSPLEMAELINSGDKATDKKEKKVVLNVLEDDDLSVQEKANIINSIEYNDLININYKDLEAELSKYGVQGNFRIGKTKEIIVNDSLRELEKIKLNLLREDSVDEKARQQVEESGIVDIDVLKKNVKILEKNLSNCTATQRKIFMAKRNALKNKIEELIKKK